MCEIFIAKKQPENCKRRMTAANDAVLGAYFDILANASNAIK